MSVTRSRPWITTAVFALTGVLLGLFIAVPATSGDLGSVLTGPVRFIIAVVAAAVVLTSLHEAAHAVVGRLAGWEVFGVTIGHGRRLATAHLGSVRLELRGTLVGGTTIANATGRRWRDVVMLAAGVTVESTAIVAALLWQPDSAWAEHVRWAIVLVAGIDIAANLWPRRVDTGPVTGLATDGAQLLSVLTTPDQWRHDLHQMRLTPARARLVQTLYGGDLDGAVDMARAEAEADPTDEQTRVLTGTLLLLADRWREAFDHLAPLAAAPDADPLLLNNAAWAAVMTFDPELLPDADRYSERAADGRPNEPACANTRGATLVLLGEFEDGLPFLQRAAAGRLSRKQKAYVMAFTALAESRLGDLESSREHLATSETLDGECPALPEIRRLLLDPATTSRAWSPPSPGDRLG